MSLTKVNRSMIVPDIGNIDNTSDINKPVSIAQAAADAAVLASAQSFTTTAISNLINAAPAALDTLDELAQALGDDPNFATSTATALGNRVRTDTAAQGLNSTQKTNAKTNLELENVTNDAQLKRAAGDFNSFTEKTSFADDDILIIEDSAAGNAKKKIKKSNLGITGAPPGSVIMYGGASAPDGWLLCDGAAVSRSTYAALFTAIGSTFGAGNGSTTFNLPNAQGVFPRGAGTQSIGGISYTGTLGVAQGDQMQGHKHSITDPGHAHSTNYGGLGATSSGGTVSGANPGGGLNTPSATTGISVQNPTTDGTNGTPRTGSETRPANLTFNFIIKT